MNEYHKIQSVFKRDPATNYKTFLDGDYSLPAFGYLADNSWIFTEKVDGTNIRVMFQSGVISFGGKTNNAQMPAPLVTRLIEQFKPQEELFASHFTCDVCLYGEGYGGSIQKGSCYRADQDFVLFDARINDRWLDRSELEGIATTFGLDIVPILLKGTLAQGIEMTKKGFDSTWGPFKAEGLVGRPTVELSDCFGNRMITKIKHRDFIPQPKKD